MQHRIARQAQFAQNFSGYAHHFGELLRPQHDQRDRQYQYDLKQVHAMTAVPLTPITSHGFEKRREHARQIFIVPVWGVNDA
jgi:hypothetical protein